MDRALPPIFRTVPVRENSVTRERGQSGKERARSEGPYLDGSNQSCSRKLGQRHFCRSGSRCHGGETLLPSGNNRPPQITPQQWPIFFLNQSVFFRPEEWMGSRGGRPPGFRDPDNLTSLKFPVILHRPKTFFTHPVAPRQPIPFNGRNRL